MKLTAEQKKAFLKQHLPHRICLLTTFRDRQTWLKDSLSKNENACDLLRVSKDSALISIRMFADFLGLHESSQSRPDDVSVEMLGGKRAQLAELTGGEQAILRGLCDRANKELAHLTVTYKGHDRFNTAKALVNGIDIIERLLRKNLYEQLQLPFPDLAAERRLDNNVWQFVDGPHKAANFPKG